MKELTEENYNYLTPNFEGIIVSIPTTIGYNAELYVYGNKINEDNKLEISCMAYNMEDGAINGFSYFGNTDFQSIFRDFKYMKHYQFENLNEFCNWYLHKDDKLHQALEQFVEDTKKFYEKDWIHEKGNTNTPPSTVPKQPSKGNKLMSQDNTILKKYRCEDVYTQDEIRDKINPRWNTRREKLADVLKLLELRDLRQNTIDMLVENMTSEKRCYLEKQLERDEKRIEDFLNEEV